MLESIERIQDTEQNKTVTLAAASQFHSDQFLI